MRETYQRGIQGAMLALGLITTGSALATNGYFAHGYSAQQRGMAGAGTALGSDAFVGSINPALLTRVGDRMDFNFSSFSPFRDFTVKNEPDITPVSGAGLFQINRLDEDGRPMDEVRSKHEFFPIPGMAFSWRIDDKSVWGVTVYGNGGLNTEYDRGRATFAAGDAAQILPLQETCEGAFGGGGNVGSPGVFALCGGEQSDPGVDLIQLFVVPTYAREFGDRLSLGISPIFVAQRFKSLGLQAFARFSENPDRVTNNGTEFSFGGGARVGMTYELASWLRFGASYQSRIQMTNFDKYRGLFNKDGAFDIPSTWNVGIALIPSHNHRFAIDYQRINFNEVSAVGDDLNPNQFVNGCARPILLGGPVDFDTCLGGENGPGFGWHDVTTYKFGYEYQRGDFTYRVGYSNNTQPIQSSEVLFNILAPAVPEHHYTAGLTWQYSNRVGFDFAVMYAADNTVSGKNPLSNVEGGALSLLNGGPNFGSDPNDQDIELSMYQVELTFGVNFRYD
ncbi:MAG: outer membrane protein transport protein [Salinisphaeraceae bacterium]